MSLWDHGEVINTACSYLHRKQIVTCHCETMAESRLLHVTVRPWQKTDRYMSLWDHAADLHTSKTEKKTDCYMSLWDHAAVLHIKSRSEKKTDGHHYVSVRLRRTDMHCVQLVCIESREARRKQIVTCHCETMQLIWIHLEVWRKLIVTCYCETMQLICIRLKVRRKEIVTCHCETIAENRLLHVTVRPCSWSAYV